MSMTDDERVVRDAPGGNMKIAVTRCDGDTEILNLNDPVKVNEGSAGGQASIHSAEGLDHYFRLSDGRYDGYAMGAPDRGWTEQQARTYLDSIHAERRIIPVSIRYVLRQRAWKVWLFVRWHWNHFIGTKGF